MSVDATAAAAAAANIRAARNYQVPSCRHGVDPSNTILRAIRLSSSSPPSVLKRSATNVNGAIALLKSSGN